MTATNNSLRFVIRTSAIRCMGARVPQVVCWDRRYKWHSICIERQILWPYLDAVTCHLVFYKIFAMSNNILNESCRA